MKGGRLSGADAPGAGESEKRLFSCARRCLQEAARVSADEAVFMPPEAEVSIAFASDEQVRALNRKWRGKDAPTNVLAFAANDGIASEGRSPLLGDIALAFETLAREARSQGKKPENHLCHLLIHGFLHLLGYDHGNAREARIMENLEVRVLERLGIADPYEEGCFVK